MLLRSHYIYFTSIPLDFLKLTLIISYLMEEHLFSLEILVLSRYFELPFSYSPNSSSVIGGNAPSILFNDTNELELKDTVA